MGEIEILGGDQSSILSGDAGASINRETPGAAPIGMSVVAKLQQRQRTLSLSPEGKAYCNELKQLADEANVCLNFSPFRSGGIDTLLITDETNTFGVVFGFAESASKVGDQPCVLHTLTAVEHLKARGISVLNTLIIGREDYNRAPIAFQGVCDLINTFAGIEASTLTLADFKGYEIMMSTNPQEVAEYMDRNSMHTIPPRQDIGAVFKILPPGEKPEDATAMAAMTGYTTFLSEIVPGAYGGAAAPIFTPMTHMEFHSGIADPAILALLLISTYEYYCTKYGWLNQFDSFRIGEINIGNLIPDDNGAPWFCPDPGRRDTFIRQYIPKPAIAVLDCMTGRHQLPLALMLKGTPEADQAFKERIARFLGIADANAIPNVVLPTTAPVFEYTGVIKQDVMIDSNAIDYLYLVNKGVTNQLELEPWLNYYADPTIKPKLFATWYPHHWESRYQNNIKIVNPQFLNVISDCLNRLNIKINFETRQYQQFGAGILSDPTILNSASQVHLQSTQKISGLGRGYSMFSL